MPRENRKRGKKHKKRHLEEAIEARVGANRDGMYDEADHGGGPSWIVHAASAPKRGDETVNPEAPFGYVDVAVKAYFRSVDVQIREWQGGSNNEVDGDVDLDLNQNRRQFFLAALGEMRGKERQLATDSDCSVLLERMAYSMDDFVRRVFVDSLTGSYATLARHRFASHICQTMFSVAPSTIARETRGILPPPPESDMGELRTLTQLVLDISEELLPVFPDLIMDPFASHVVRSLLKLLSGRPEDPGAVRSKKSAVWKAKQGPMRSVFFEDEEDEQRRKGGKVKEGAPTTRTPPEFSEMARRFVKVLRDSLSDNEVRALTASKVASPGLQVILEVEADLEMANAEGSIMDTVMVGLISASRPNPTAGVEESDYLGTLLRDTTASHLLEIIVRRCPAAAFDALWRTYFSGKLARLGVHPVANFVLAHAAGRLREAQLEEAFREMGEAGVWGKLIRTSRTGVLRALVERAAKLGSLGTEAAQAALAAFELVTPDDHLLLVPCAVALLTLQRYRDVAGSLSEKASDGAKHGGKQSAPDPDPLEPTVQGALLLQALLKLPAPHNNVVLDSIASLPDSTTLRIAHSAPGSRVYDAILASPSVSRKAKTACVLSFVGRYHELVDDRIGSRVGDKCWEWADTYLKEKIARSLIPHEQQLAGSYYGKYFAKNLAIYVLQRKPAEWRDMQAAKSRVGVGAGAVTPIKGTATEPSGVKEKAEILSAGNYGDRGARMATKRQREDDEIEAVFSSALGNKSKKAALALRNVSYFH